MARIWPVDQRGTRYTTPGELVAHILGEPIGRIRHMCPDAGCRRPDGTVNPFCIWCCGAGDLSPERLGQWEKAQWDGVQV